MEDPIETGARALAERRLIGSTAPDGLYHSEGCANWPEELRRDAIAMRGAMFPHEPPDAVIFDIDGTIADVEHRRPYLLSEKPDWKAFNAAIGDDAIHANILRLLRTMRAAGNAIVLCSGRDGGFRRLTELWLTFNQIHYDGLYMRAAGDHRKDHVVKTELLDQIIADGFRPWLVVDDRSSVVAAWRARGLTCLQCAEGDF